MESEMSWYLNNSDVVISTRIRFARNLKDFRFNLKGKEAELLEDKIKEELPVIRIWS